MLCVEKKIPQEIVARRLLFGIVRMGVKMAENKSGTERETTENPAKIVVKQVFEVANGRLGIGVYSRPLLEKEMRRFRAAWEVSPPAGMEASEIDPRRISFVAHPDGLPAAWDRINSLLAAATGKSGKARKVA